MSFSYCFRENMWATSKNMKSWHQEREKGLLRHFPPPLPLGRPHWWTPGLCLRGPLTKLSWSMWSKGSSHSMLLNNNHFKILWRICSLVQKLYHGWPCAPWLMMPPWEWRRRWLRPWGESTILPPLLTAGLPEGGASLALLAIGLTDSLKRCLAAPACKQLRGSHTFDVLASTLNDIHSEFEIGGRVCEQQAKTAPTS